MKGLAASLLLLLLPSVCAAEPVRLWVAQTTDVPPRTQIDNPQYRYTVVHEEQHPDFTACRSAAADYTQALVTQQGWEQLGVNKVRTPIGKTPGYVYLEINCGGLVSSTKAASESVKKLTDRVNELAEALRRAREGQDNR